MNTDTRLHFRRPEDARIPVADAQKLYDVIGAQQKQLKVLTKAEGGVVHCQLDNLHRAHYYMFDWLAEILGALSRKV